MSCESGPNTITTGLVFNVDAANTKSYPGSGTSWYDISSNAKTGTITTPSWSSSGYFQYAGTNRSTGFAYSTTLYDWWTADYTIDAWIYPTSFTGWGSGGVYPTLVGNIDPVGGSNYWSFGINGSGYITFYYWTGSQNTVTSTLQVSLNTWTYIGMTKTSSGLLFYKNGVTNGSYTAIVGTPLTSVSYNLTIGGYNNVFPNGNVSSIKLYKNKALSAAEFLQNFYAYRGRYGI